MRARPPGQVQPAFEAERDACALRRRPDRSFPACYPAAMANHSRRRKIIKWSGISVGILLVLLFLIILIPNLIITRSSHDFILSSPEEAPRAQAAIVLGAGVYAGGVPSPMLADRVAMGVKLYQSGKVAKVLLTGAPQQVEVDSMYRAVDVYDVRTALVVTQAFHEPRAVYIARTLGLDATGVVADVQPYGVMADDNLREYLARIKAVFELHLTHPEPDNLGPGIPIMGDGRRSRAWGYAPGYGPPR
jgi:SanA protein